MFKRGVSSVVATVLIVLLVVVGVAVLWAAVKPAIDRTADTVQSDCFGVQLEVTKCEIDTSDSNPTLWDAIVSIKRNVGQGDLRQVAVSYGGDMLYVSTVLALLNANYLVGHVSSQESFVVRQNAVGLSELGTLPFVEMLSGNQDFNSNAFMDGVSVVIPPSYVFYAGTFSLSALLTSYPTYPTGVLFVPKSVSARAVVGDSLQICSLESSVDCTCTGAGCSVAIIPNVNAPSLCNGLPCTINLP